MGKILVFSRMLIAIAAAAMLCACIDVSVQINLKEDTSGTVKLDYTVMRTFINLGTIDDDRPFYTVPVSRADFERTTSQIEGLTLKSFNMEENSSELHVTAQMEFASLEALSELFSSSGPGAIEIADQNGLHTYRHTIFSGSGADIDADSREMIDTFFSENTASFTLIAPDPIQSSSHGEFEGRTASVSFSISEVTLQTEPLVWEVAW